MACCARRDPSQEIESEWPLGWDRYEEARFQHIRSLPPAGNGPLRFAWDPEDAELYEKLVAALDRDGCVILEQA